MIPGLRSAELDDSAAPDAFSTERRHMEVAMSILEFRELTDIAILDFEV